MNENTFEANISRRGFLKGAAALGVGIAAASTGASLTMPKAAWADTTLADGTYNVCANLYISKSIVLIKKDAYFTNPTNPNATGNLPDTPTTDLNATLVVENGIASVSVPLVNECFMLLSASDGNSVSVTATETIDAIYPDTGGNGLTRISNITFRLANMGGTYTLGACQEYAAYENPPFPMSLLVPGYLDWTATLSVDFDTAVLA